MTTSYSNRSQEQCHINDTFHKGDFKLNYFTKVLVCQSTSGLKINMDRIPSFTPNILISPLDWGLGHATRCIPIIQMLIQKNCNVLVACDAKIKALLFNEFPQIGFVDLKGYNIRYSKNSWTLPLHIGKQIPKILSTIQYENERLKEIVKEHDVHGVISDNRYGFYHKTIPSAFITHQLRIKTLFGNFFDNYLQKFNYHFINKFSCCWVPDNATKQNLAGQLSHSIKKPTIPLKYIGVLSRFKRVEKTQEKHLLILLSGPEPQRTVFESLLIKQLIGYKGSVVLIRGLPLKSEQIELPANIIVYNHLIGERLNLIANEASIIISRCGYSTVMDLAVLKKKSILVPTPGQTEQEYLAKHLMKMNFALCIDQKTFSVRTVLDLSRNFNYQFTQFSTENYLEQALDDFITSVKTAKNKHSI